MLNEGGQSGSLKRGIVTKRQLNPNSPNYLYLDGTKKIKTKKEFAIAKAEKL